jgi:hypothetical protein
MSLDLYLLAVTPKKLQALLKHPEKIDGFFFPDEGEHPGFHVSRNFVLTHFALTGTESGIHKGPLDWAIWGGATVEDPDGESFPYLQPNEVREVAAALRAVSKAGFFERFDKHIGDEGYYSVERTKRAMIKEECHQTLVALRDYYAAAAKRGDAMLKCIA